MLSFLALLGFRSWLRAFVRCRVYQRCIVFDRRFGRPWLLRFDEIEEIATSQFEHRELQLRWISIRHRGVEMIDDGDFDVGAIVAACRDRVHVVHIDD